ncbi:MAG: winged helix-turn-helix transcriptional regulator [Roseitalea sp.]|jgi:DNA-binding transcriptional ArsR family regulator|nr:winged helix-turn-helix transcriptional regulator [Roseitalea sp.]MBO6721107.1 winged helix-turn-helix transcriptional regulator [Roseitalea sp.]MBO6744165.1 winged helix-turn-helix transcriptional regulator [Roseitalea sp.]
MNVDALEPHIAEAAKLMEMLSQPVRLRILCALSEQKWSVVKLAEAVNLSQPAMSHHLRKLREAGLVKTERDAQTIYYSLHGREVTEVLAVLHDLYCPHGMDGEKDTDGQQTQKAE